MKWITVWDIMLIQKMQHKNRQTCIIHPDSFLDTFIHILSDSCTIVRTHSFTCISISVLLRIDRTPFRTCGVSNVKVMLSSHLIQSTSCFISSWIHYCALVFVEVTCHNNAHNITGRTYCSLYANRFFYVGSRMYSICLVFFLVSFYFANLSRNDSTAIYSYERMVYFTRFLDWLDVILCILRQRIVIKI